MLQVFDNLFLQPLLSIYAYVFELSPEFLGTGERLIVFSVILNLALVPLYYQMELRSRLTRQIKERVAREVARMKKHFRGREQYFYIRTVYRQHRYRPIAELFRSADLFVQILVFATVYRFLSGLESLHGASFGPIADLSGPDRLLGGFNVLPLMMTAINAAAVFSYVSDRGKRLQALALAAIFLVLLYGSAAGLVLYWTANNLFSLLRNLLQRHLASQPSSPVRRLLSEWAIQR